MKFFFIFNLFVLHCINKFAQGEIKIKDIGLLKTLVWGPGLNPENITLRARYIFIQLVDKNGKKFVLCIFFNVYIYTYVYFLQFCRVMLK